jgi:hypothetical protein
LNKVVDGVESKELPSYSHHFDSFKILLIPEINLEVAKVY